MLIGPTICLLTQTLLAECQVSAISQAPELAVSPSDAGMMWRVPGNAVANALFLLVRGHGRNASYDEVIHACGASKRTTNLKDVVDAAVYLNTSTEAYDAVPEDLLGVELPVIVHLDPTDGNYDTGGRLALITRIYDNGRRLELVDCVTVLPYTIPQDDFRRLWSGGMIAFIRRPWWRWCLYGVLLCTCSYTLIILAKQWRPSKSKNATI